MATFAQQVLLTTMTLIDYNIDHNEHDLHHDGYTLTRMKTWAQVSRETD